MLHVDRRSFLATGLALMAGLPEGAPRRADPAAPLMADSGEVDVLSISIPSPLELPPGESRVLRFLPRQNHVWTDGMALDSDDPASLLVRRVTLDGKDFSIGSRGVPLSFFLPNRPEADSFTKFGIGPLRERLEVEVHNIDSKPHKVCGRARALSFEDLWNHVTPTWSQLIPLGSASILGGGGRAELTGVAPEGGAFRAYRLHLDTSAEHRATMLVESVAVDGVRVPVSMGRGTCNSCGASSSIRPFENSFAFLAGSQIKMQIQSWCATNQVVSGALEVCVLPDSSPTPVVAEVFRRLSASQNMA